MQFVRALILCGLLMPGLGIPVFAQTWPSKPVRIVIPFTPGGGSDVVARVLAQRLGESTGQNFIVDNRPGAGGNIAFEHVAKSEPDGYTILNGTPGIVTNLTLFRKVAYKIEDFTAVSLLGKAPLLVAVHPSLPVHSISDLVKLAKAKPGAVRYGSPGAGSSSHLASEVFGMMAKVDLLHVPYKGGPQVLNDVISGQVEMTTLPLTETLPQVRANRLRGLAQTGEKRSSIAPDIPTLDEAGIKGYAVTTWYVIFVPAATPRDVVNRLHTELIKVLKIPDVQERLKGVGVGEIIGSTPEQAAQFVKAEAVRWADVIRKSGAKAD